MTQNLMTKTPEYRGQLFKQVSDLLDQGKFISAYRHAAKGGVERSELGTYLKAVASVRMTFKKLSLYNIRGHAVADPSEDIVDLPLPAERPRRGSIIMLPQISDN